MTKTELQEILKMIDEKFIEANNEIYNSSLHADRQYYIGKKHALKDFEHDLEIKYKHVLEAPE